MKYLITLSAFLFLNTSVFASIETVTFTINKMSCVTCPVVVKGALKDLDGVDTVVTSLETKTAVVTFDNEKIKISDMMTATENAGFPALVKKDEHN